MTRAASSRGGRAALAPVVAALLMLAAGSARATDVTPAGDDPATAAERVNRDASGFQVEGRRVVRAPLPIVWEVLTDYEGIPGFVSSMRESRITGRGERHLVVEQAAVGRLFMFSRRMHVTLFVEEIPPTTIRFEDVVGNDFEDYRGEWRIEPRGDAVEIVYRLAARPSFSVPDFIARRLFRRMARDLLDQVKTEIERRAARAPAAARAAFR